MPESILQKKPSMTQVLLGIWYYFSSVKLWLFLTVLKKKKWWSNSFEALKQQWNFILFCVSAVSFYYDDDCYCWQIETLGQSTPFFLFSKWNLSCCKWWYVFLFCRQQQFLFLNEIFPSNFGVWYQIQLQILNLYFSFFFHQTLVSSFMFKLENFFF